MELNRISMRGASFGRVPFPRISLEGRTGGTPEQELSGYPLAIDIDRPKIMKEYTIFGNTNEGAKGVGNRWYNLMPETIERITSRGFTFRIEEGYLYIQGRRTQSGEVVVKFADVKAGHKYIFFPEGTIVESESKLVNLQLWESGHDVLYASFGEVITPPVDMGAYIQIDKENIYTSYISFIDHPAFVDLTEFGMEEVTGIDDLVERLGISQFDLTRLGSPSFVAPIRVSSESGDTLYPSVLSSPLHKIGDIVDYKESNGKEWHGLMEYAFTGQETINYYDTQIGAPYPKRFVWLTSGIAGATNTINCASNDYTATDYENLLRGNTNKVVSSEVRGYVNIVDSDYTSVADFQAHLAERYASGNPVKVVLILATPTEVQGEPLARLAIPKGESIVTLDTEVEPSNITAKI